MDLASIHIRMAPCIKVTGSTISSTARVKKSGQMVHNTKETTNLAKRMALVSFYGLIGLCMRESLSITIFMVKESTNGQTVENF